MNTWETPPKPPTEATYIGQGIVVGLLLGFGVGWDASMPFAATVLLVLAGMACGAWVGWRMWRAKVRRVSTWSGTRRARDETRGAA